MWNLLLKSHRYLKLVYYKKLDKEYTVDVWRYNVRKETLAIGILGSIIDYPKWLEVELK